MEGISDIRIMGMDETRPPKIRKEPYIDLIFRLTHKAPSDWCQDFNNLLAGNQYAPKISLDEGLYIEAWVRSSDEIVAQLQVIKHAITQCTQEYIDRIQMVERTRDAGNNLLPAEDGPQARLNSIIAGLDFSDEV